MQVLSQLSYSPTATRMVPHSAPARTGERPARSAPRLGDGILGPGMRPFAGSTTSSFSGDGPSSGGLRPPGQAVSRQAGGINYQLHLSSRARRLRLTVSEDGDVLLTLPRSVGLQVADEFVASRAAWVRRHRARLAEERERQAARGPIADGASIPYAGVLHRLEVRTLPLGRRRARVEHDGAAEGAHLRDPRLRVWVGSDERRPLAVILEAWLRAQARPAIERRIAARAPQLGVRPAALAIRDQRSRWGSASSQGRLSFNWRLILAPQDVLDYVVVHELAHLRVPGHTTRFWRLVVDIVPQAKEARRWLREHARELRWVLAEHP